MNEYICRVLRREDEKKEIVGSQKLFYCLCWDEEVERKEKETGKEKKEKKTHVCSYI